MALSEDPSLFLQAPPTTRSVVSSWKRGRVGLSSSLDAYNLSCCLLLAPFCESTLERGGRGRSWGGSIQITGARVSATGARGCCDFQGPICSPAHWVHIAHNNAWGRERPKLAEHQCIPGILCVSRSFHRSSSCKLLYPELKKIHFTEMQLTYKGLCIFIWTHTHIYVHMCMGLMSVTWWYWR